MREPTYVTIDKLAEHFGLAVTTLQKWVKTGNIPRGTYVKAGQTYRFNLRAVEHALTGTEEPPKRVPEQQLRAKRVSEQQLRDFVASHDAREDAKSTDPDEDM